jgi:hypothetical protein
MSKSSDRLLSDQMFVLLSAGFTDAAPWTADQRRNALCPTDTATSPLAHETKQVWTRRVRYAMPFSK